MSCSTPLTFISFFFFLKNYVKSEALYGTTCVSHLSIDLMLTQYHPKCFEQPHLSWEATLTTLWNELVESKQPGIGNELVACHQPFSDSVLGLNSSLAKCGRNIQLACLKVFTATAFSKQLCWGRDAISRAMILQTAVFLKGMSHVDL